MRNKKARFMITLAVCTLVSTGVQVVQAQGAGEDIPTFDTFLAWLSGPLLGSAVAVAVSWVVEFWPKYQDLEPRWRQLSFLGFCLLLSLGAATLRWVLEYVDLSFDPLYWHALWAAFGAFGVGSLAHKQGLPKYEDRAVGPEFPG